MFLRLKSEVINRFKKINTPQYWLDMLVEELQRKQKQNVAVTGQALAILRHNEFGDIHRVIPAINIVTNDGDLYYAQSAVAETPTDDFDAAAAGLRLGTASTAPVKTNTDVTTEDSNGRLAIDATYPKTNDGDSDNTGAGTDIVTWRFSYSTSEGNITGIAEGAIVDNRTTPTAALTHFLFAASFNKTSSDTLKVFVNHTFNGT